MGTTNTSLYPAAGASPFSHASGVNYSRHGGHIKQVTQSEAATDISQIAQVFQMIRVFDWNDYVMQEAQNAGLEVCLGISNADVTSLASGDCSAYAARIAQYKDTIKLISMGNEVFFNGLDASTVATAIDNVYGAIKTTCPGIQVTTDCIWASVGPTQAPNWTPESAVLTNNGKTILAKLKALYGSNAYLLCSLYPYLDVKGWVTNNGVAFAQGLLNYALGSDPSKGSYANQFDADYTALRLAMQKGGYEDVTVLVSEVGWSTAGYLDWCSTPQNLTSFLANYEQWIRANTLHLTTFFFEMYDENKPGDADERSFGLYTRDNSRLKDGVILPNWV